MTTTTRAGGGAQLILRRAVATDRSAIIELCRSSLGWANGGVDEAFFAWKHDQNPAGASPAWVAVAPDGRLVGLRVFLRWRFVDPSGRRLTAVRAVDTATHPDYQGQGIFRRLTLGALPELRAEGVDFVFNTPNAQSRPGYLKMGWGLVGRVPVAVRPGSLRRLTHLRGARVAAEKWSEPSTAGVAATEVLADAGAVGRLVANQASRTRIDSDVDPAHLRWRYSFVPLQYRALPLGDSAEQGLIVFRVRRRGSARECTICEVLAPRGVSVRAALSHVVTETRADYLIKGGHGPIDAGFVPAPTLGPILTWKPLCRPGVPRLGELSLALGDVELF